ncbi:MAG: hypothetical protein WEB00_11245 [Dehalococcoidia bacterium]
MATQQQSTNGHVPARALRSIQAIGYWLSAIGGYVLDPNDIGNREAFAGDRLDHNIDELREALRQYRDTREAEIDAREKAR